MAPAPIKTSFKTLPRRFSSDSSTMSSAEGSPTAVSPKTFFYGSPTSEARSPRFFARLCSPRSRSLSIAVPNCSALPSMPSPTRTEGQHRSESVFHASPRTSMSMPSTVRPRNQKRNSGTTMQVGRHGNDWLFGGFSFTEAMKDLLRSTDNEHGRDS